MSTFFFLFVFFDIEDTCGQNLSRRSLHFGHQAHFKKNFTPFFDEKMLKMGVKKFLRTYYGLGEAQKFLSTRTKIRGNTHLKHIKKFFEKIQYEKIYEKKKSKTPPKKGFFGGVSW